MFSDKLELGSFTNLLDTTLIGKALGAGNEVWESIDSTNQRAIILATEGAPEGIVIMARQQTAGRGRLGRTWVSPADTGLYFSVLVRPQLPLNQLPLMSLATGTAVVKAIGETTGISPGTKWVNDIVWQGRKLGGILCETARSSGATGAAQLALVIGIGINLITLPPDAPEDIRKTAIALDAISSSPVNPNYLAASLCRHLETAYLQLVYGDTGGIIDKWKRASVTLGKQIIATTGDGTVEGVAEDIAADGALVVRQSDGKKVILRAGEVSIRNRDGSYA